MKRNPADCILHPRAGRMGNSRRSLRARISDVLFRLFFAFQILLVTLCALLLLYILKSALGINLFADIHLGDLIPL
ncbi:MAG: hypothetical protein PWP23_2667 [Candidatus Sumerlaeota bacterium]|nr:hypothetical protein [Candidatus Sumerlaeota bacterium]